MSKSQKNLVVQLAMGSAAILVGGVMLNIFGPRIEAPLRKIVG